MSGSVYARKCACQAMCMPSRRRNLAPWLCWLLCGTLAQGPMRTQVIQSSQPQFPPTRKPSPVLPNIPPAGAVPKALVVLGPNRLVVPNAGAAGLAAPNVDVPNGLDDAPKAGAEAAPKGLAVEGPNKLLPVWAAGGAPKGEPVPKGEPAAGADAAPNMEGLDPNPKADAEEAGAPNAAALAAPKMDPPEAAPKAVLAPKAGALAAPNPAPNAGAEAWPNAG